MKLRKANLIQQITDERLAHLERYQDRMQKYHNRLIRELDRRKQGITNGLPADVTPLEAPPKDSLKDYDSVLAKLQGATKVTLGVGTMLLEVELI